jgi:hypothetical protein
MVLSKAQRVRKKCSPFLYLPHVLHHAAQQEAIRSPTYEPADKGWNPSKPAFHGLSILRQLSGLTQK